jgi:hypothetical protein
MYMYDSSALASRNSIERLRSPQYGGLGLAEFQLGETKSDGSAIAPDLGSLRLALLKRFTKTDLCWIDVPLRGGFTIKVCSPVRLKVSQQELQPVARYLDGPIPAGGLYLYVPVDANETNAFALKWNVLPLTRAVADQAHNAAVYVKKPEWPPPKDAKRRMYDFVGYSQKLQQQRGYPLHHGVRLVSGAHKLWVMSAKGPVINHGFHAPVSVCRTIPGLLCVPNPVLDAPFVAIQNISAKHNARHWDYSQLLQFMTDLRNEKGEPVDLCGALLNGHAAVWDEHPAKLPAQRIPGIDLTEKTCRSGTGGPATGCAFMRDLGFHARFGEPPAPHPAVVGLIPFCQAQTQATIANALSIVRLISEFHGIPWRVPFVILEHEGGVRAFRHPDGAMQVTDVAKPGAIHAMPRELKLVLASRALTDPIATAALDAAVRTEFPRQLAVQIACGTQLLKNALDRFSGYIALAYIAYNAGDGNAARVITAGRVANRPAGTTDEQWKCMCGFGASLYHQSPRDVRIVTGQWQCDANIRAWFRRSAVFDQQSGRQLIGYEYLRSIQSCIRPGRPAIPCVLPIHGQRRDGTGDVACSATRAGTLDKLYNPAQLDRPYRDALAPLLGPIPEDNLPIKVINGRMAKMPLACGSVAPSSRAFDGIA